jgi:hypothetical protein
VPIVKVVAGKKSSDMPDPTKEIKIVRAVDEPENKKY